MGDDAVGVEIQERDIEILLGLFECRVMSLRHVAELYFAGKGESAKKRVQKLKAGGYLRERPRDIGDPSVLHLSAKAFDVLRHSGRLDRFPPLSKALFERRTAVSEFNLRHELEVMDVRTAMIGAIQKQPPFSIAEFSTWPLLSGFKACYHSPKFGRKEVAMRPDGFIRIREETDEGTCEDTFFLEVDRSHEAQGIIGQKAACYLDFYQSGGMALRFGARREDFRDFPFRVLMIFRNEERRNNAAERLLRNVPPIVTQVWLCTFAEAVENPLGEIWVRPKDYLEVTRGTRFDPMAGNGTSLYRRQTERERLVEKGIRRHALFSPADGQSGAGGKQTRPVSP